MKKELEQKLAKKYPQLFADLGGNPMETCMAWGLACGEGWYDILDRLCQELMDLKPSKNLRLAQVKEKFATLRVYIDGDNSDKLYKAINKYEKESSETCESCGTKENVAVRGSHYIQTLCESCDKKIEK